MTQEPPRIKRKVLLMGKSGSGKTSMRSIIFANYIARDTQRLGATIDVEHAHVRFLGNLVLNLWDCGGQEAFMENYLESQRDHIFTNVAVLIYVFDCVSKDAARDLDYFRGILEALVKCSPTARTFCLIHKMDLTPDELREQIFHSKETELMEIAEPLGMDLTCFKTSIWDETLYKAWSAIVYSLIPQVEMLEEQLRLFAAATDADEVVLFERATFLVIAHATLKEHHDVHRFEKISNIIKQFKLSCTKAVSTFQSMEVLNSNFTAFLDAFTYNTYVMVIMSDKTIQSAATRLNIAAARKHFEKFVVV
jgi:Ras-related GTP-binding protein A/B